MNNFFDIKNTFLNLIQKTYPYGKEKEKQMTKETKD